MRLPRAVLYGVLLLVPSAASPSSSKCQLAKVQIEHVGEAVSLFRLRYERLPSNEEGLRVLVNPLGAQRFLPVEPIDPWERAYRYRQISEESRFEIWSTGADGLSGSADDITLETSCPWIPPIGCY